MTQVRHSSTDDGGGSSRAAAVLAQIRSVNIGINEGLRERGRAGEPTVARRSTDKNAPLNRQKRSAQLTKTPRAAAAAELLQGLSVPTLDGGILAVSAEGRRGNGAGGATPPSGVMAWAMAVKTHDPLSHDARRLPAALLSAPHGGGGGEALNLYFMIRIKAVPEIPLRFYSFHIRFLS
jgi:hypothetical protein